MEKLKKIAQRLIGKLHPIETGLKYLPNFLIVSSIPNVPYKAPMLPAMLFGSTNISSPASASQYPPEAAVSSAKDSTGTSFSFDKARIRWKIKLDCTGDPPLLLISRHTALGLIFSVSKACPMYFSTFRKFKPLPPGRTSGAIIPCNRTIRTTFLDVHDKELRILFMVDMVDTGLLAPPARRVKGILR